MIGSVPLNTVNPLVYVQRENNPSWGTDMTVKLPLRFEQGPIPKNSTIHERQVHVFFAMFWAMNFGHALGRAR